MLSIYMIDTRNARNVDLTPSAVVGLVCAVARATWIPARTWALESAIEGVEAVLAEDTTSIIARAITRFPRGTGGVQPRFGGIGKVVLELARMGHFAPTGHGWTAGYAPSEAWLAAHRSLYRELSSRDRKAIASGVQQFKASLRTLLKKSVAS
jgi:hypothetical protein